MVQVGCIMKTGNNYSSFLDEFAQNYRAMSEIHANIAHKSEELSSLIKEAHETEQILFDTNTDSIPEPPTYTRYQDFLDKFAKQKIANENRIKEETFKFITTEPNRDNHVCELILRKAAGKYKIKLTHYSGSFDYAAFQSIWHFADNEAKTADKVFNTLALVINEIKNQHNKRQKHSASLAPIIREAVKPIAKAHQYRKNVVFLDENDLQSGESDWEQTIYGSKYPQYQEESKQSMLNDNHNEGAIKRTMYTGRNSKTTKEI